MSHASPKGEDLTSRERSTDKCQGHAVGDGEFSIEVPTGYCSKFDNFGVSAFEKDVTTSEDYSLLDGEAEGRRDFIRLQAHPDANLYYCLQSKASTFEVLQKMRQVTEKMEHTVHRTSTNVPGLRLLPLVDLELLEVAKRK